MDFKTIIKDRGFPLSFIDFGRIVKLTPHRLRVIYYEDTLRFFSLLDIAIKRWNSICGKVDNAMSIKDTACSGTCLDCQRHIDNICNVGIGDDDFTPIN